MSKTVLNYNEKGGCGKTTLNGIESYILAQKGYKVLIIDFDPQKNLTQMMGQTFNVEPSPLTLFSDGLMNYDLTDSITKLSDNLDIISADKYLKDFSNKVTNASKKRRWNILRECLEPINNDYDYILIDTPPTLNDIVMNAIFASDVISLILQTQRLAYNSSIDTISDLQDIQENDGADFDFIGVVLYLFMRSKINREVKRDSKKMFGDALYKNPIKFQERVNGFTDSGIKKKDFWDIRVLKNYETVTNELIQKVEEMNDDE